MNQNQIQIDFSIYEHRENNPGSQAHFEENKHKFNNQCKIVYEALLRGEKLTTTKALLNYGVGDLRRRIKDLKDIWKIPIKDHYIENNYKEFYLEL